MKIEISEDAQEDLLEGFRFYEAQQTELGSYFLNCLFSDIDALSMFGGVHPIVFGHHRSLSKRFPFAIYYRVDGVCSLPRRGIIRHS